MTRTGWNPVRSGELVPAEYAELRELATRLLDRRRSPGPSRATSLVHEAWLRLSKNGTLRFTDQGHFYRTAARSMRYVLVDQARRRRADKRGGNRVAHPLDSAIPLAAEQNPDLLALDDALNRLGKRDPRKVRVVELRFFGGLSIEETAEALDISPGTVRRDWALAKAWLYLELAEP